LKKSKNNVKKDDIQNSNAAQFKLTNDISLVRNDHLLEHCSANLNQIQMIGRNLGQQIRIEIPTANRTALALYTVTDVHDAEPDVVYVGYTNLEKPWERLELEGANVLSGKVNAQVTAEGLTDAEAEARSEFIENVTDNGDNRKLIVIAPHGGNIEKYTDEQAEHVAQKLSSKYVSTWICKGFKKGGGAYKRWHITSTDINEESFPKLKTIIARGKFEYSVAFHGWTNHNNNNNNNNSICIGGSMEWKGLKREIKEKIVDAVRGSGIAVNTDYERTCPRNFNGNHKRNIVKRLGIKSLQIEQSEEARKCYGIDIADVVADVIGPKIQI
jgi:phage replication-related protein YjqB (UPF0714/DUF867 family)